MNSNQTEEKKTDLNQTSNVTIKKIKITKKNNKNNPNLLSNSQSQTNFYNLYKKKKQAKNDKFKTKSIDSILLKTNNIFSNTNNNIRSELSKIRKINKINENNGTNSNYNLFKSAFAKYNNNIINNNTNININESIEHKLLYEDIIKLKTRINKLKLEYSFIKSLTRKKDEEIRELEKYKEEAKYYYGKNDKKIFFEKLKYLKLIVDLKNKYEDIKIQFRQLKDNNNAIINHIKNLDIAEIKRCLLAGPQVFPQ